jgi:PAS domain-containing protein
VDGQIVATPTLVREFPPPERRLIGSLANTTGLFVGLELMVPAVRNAHPPPRGELVRLRTRLTEAEETLRAIRAGEVDAVVVAEKRGARVFTLEGAEHAYRVLIESINEGALTLTMDETILYANQRFAQLVRCPLEQVVGGSLRRFLSTEDRRALRSLMTRPGAPDPRPRRSSSPATARGCRRRSPSALSPRNISARRPSAWW